MFLRYKCLSELFVAIALVMLIGSTSKAGMLGLWRFNDGDASDTSGNSPPHDGTFVDGASLVNDVPDPLRGGQSVKIDGGGQHVLVPHDPRLNITSAMTIAAWVKPIGNGVWDGIIAKNPSDGSSLNHAGNYELRIDAGSRTLKLLFQRGDIDDTSGVNSSAFVPEGQWTHVAVTADGTNVNYYINGVIATARLPMDPGFGATNTSPLYIGSRADFFTPMDGLIDDVAIFDEVLTENEIFMIADGDFGPFLVPEPSTWLLAGIGLLGLAAAVRRRRWG